MAIHFFSRMNRVSVLLAHLQPAAASVAPAVVSGAKKPLKVVITGAAGQVGSPSPALWLN